MKPEVWKACRMARAVWFLEVRSPERKVEKSMS